MNTPCQMVQNDYHRMIEAGLRERRVGVAMAKLLK